MINIICQNCSVVFTVKPYRRLVAKFCSTKCRGLASKGTPLTPSTQRYKTVRHEGKRVLAHRYIMQQHLGRPLLHDEMVHHKNGDKGDNSLTNLQIVSAAEHGAEHTWHPVEKPCVICATIFRPHKTKRMRQQTCSQKCKQVLMKRNSSSKKIADEHIPTIRQRRANGEPLKVLAAEFGVSPTQISYIARGLSRS